MAYETLIPVNLITGFLGSGKTTLLNRLLRWPQLDKTAPSTSRRGPRRSTSCSRRSTPRP